MTKPKVAVALQQNQGLHDWITCLMLFYTKTLPVQYNPNRFAIVFLWPSQTKCIYSHVLYNNVLMWNQPVHTVMSALPPVLRGSQVE